MQHLLGSYFLCLVWDMYQMICAKYLAFGTYPTSTVGALTSKRSSIKMENTVKHINTHNTHVSVLTSGHNFSYKAVLTSGHDFSYKAMCVGV